MSSPRPKPRARATRLTREARQQQLLGAATSLFARRGIEAVSHTELAQEAGVGLSTAFAYFPTRDALISGVLASVERHYIELADRVHASTRPAPEVLLAHASEFAANVDAYPDMARVWLAWSSAVGGKYWRRYRGLEERVVAAMAETIRRGQRQGSIDASLEAVQGARLFIGAGYLIAQMKLSGRAQRDVDGFVSTLTRAVAAGVIAGS